MSAFLTELPPLLRLRDYHYIEDDFTRDVDAAEWVATLTDSGTAAVGDAAGGILVLTASDGSVADNDEAYVESPNETFKVVANKPIVFEALVQFTEANTDDANILVGLADAVGANSLVDDGAGVAAACCFVFYKVDGATLWRVRVEVNSVALADAELTAANSLDRLAHTAGTASAYQRLRIEIQPLASADGEARFFIDGVLVYKYRGDIITSGTEMQIGLGVKNGGANNQTLNVDYVSCIQRR